MKLRELESELQPIQTFTNPKLHWEQYPTSPHLTSRLVYTAHSVFDDIDGKCIADFGTGCGILTFASLMMGASYMVSIDIDPEALALTKSNAMELNCLEEMNLVCADLTSSSLGSFHTNTTAAATTTTTTKPTMNRNRPLFDTVVMNPPFGTKNNAGIDVVFLNQALSLANVVYSLHKSSTRNFLVSKFNQQGYQCKVLAQLKFDIPQMYKFHKKKTTDVMVDLLRISRTET